MFTEKKRLQLKEQLNIGTETHKMIQQTKFKVFTNSREVENTTRRNQKAVEWEMIIIHSRIGSKSTRN